MLENFSRSTILYSLGVFSAIFTSLILYLFDRFNNEKKNLGDCYRLFFLNTVVITVLLFIYFNFVENSSKNDYTADTNDLDIQVGTPNF